MLKKGSIGRKVFATLFALFVLLNAISAFHAFKFTHFVSTTGRGKRINEHHLTTPQKVMALLFGLNLSRPQNLHFPSQPFETVQLQSNVKLECWSIKTDSMPKGTVIIFHGYQATKSQMLDRSDEFLKTGYNTLLVDFMGSGGSDGNTTTIGFKEAEEVKTAFDYVASKDGRPIYLFGTSMGAASIMKALNDNPTFLPTGVILECPFGTMFKTVSVRVHKMGLTTFPTTQLLMFWGGLENGFWAFDHNPEEYAKHIEVPVLLMWGEKDERVSKEETDNIYSNLKGYKQLRTFPLCGHEDYLPQYHDMWTSTVDSFLIESPAHLEVND